MSSKVYGPMRLPESAPVRTDYPTVEPLPAAGKDIRRRRTFTCPMLRVNDKPVYHLKDISYVASGGDIKDAHCLARHCDLTGGFVVDRCTSNWARECEWLEEVETAA